MQLVRYEQQCSPLGGEGFEHVEQRIALGRRQDRGRLVENEDARVAVERLQNLDPLAHPDRQVADTGVGVDRQAVARG